MAGPVTFNPPKIPVTQPPPKVAGDRLPGAFNFDVGSPAGALRASQASKESSDDFINGLGQFFFGENNNSLLGGVPLLGPAVRAVSAVPGVKLVTDVAGYAVGGGVAAASEVAHRVPMGWIPGGTDDIFNSLPKTPEWEAVNEASNNDLLAGGNQKFDYVKKLIEDNQGNVTGTNAGLLNVSPELGAGVGGSLAQFLMQTLGLFQGGQRVVERSIAGVPKILSGMDRVDETLARAAAGETDLSPVEMAVVDKVGRGEWSKDRALDFMSSHGAGLSHDQTLQLVGTFATDPAVLLSLGSGALARSAMTGAKVVEAGMAGAEGLSRVQRAGVAVYGLTSSQLGPVAKTARAIFDPLSAFTRMGPASSAAVDLFVSDVGVKGFHAAFGRGAADVYRMADKFGITGAVQRAAGGRSITIAAQLLAARRQATSIAFGLGDKLTETVPRGSVLEDLLRKAPRDIGRAVKEETARTRKFLWGEPGSEARASLAKNYASSFGGDEAAYLDEFNGMSKDALGFAHNILYAQDERTVRLALQEGARDYTGSVPYERLNMVNDTTMHDLGAQSILDDLRKSWSADELAAGGFASSEEAQVALVKDWQARFPELRKYVIDPANSQKAIKWMTDDLDRALRNGTLPAMVTEREMAKLPQVVQDTMAAMPHRILAFRPDDAVLWNLERNAEGLYRVAGNPWIEHLLEGVEYRPGFALPTNLAGQTLARNLARPMDWLESGSNLLLKRVSSAAVRENALQRTVRHGVEELGLDEQVVRDIFRRLTEHLETVDKITVRSLTAADMWEVARSVVPRNSGVGRREILAMVLDGFEGDLRYVGLPVKFTGRMKKLIARLTGNESNFAGQFSEDFYNRLRFRHNPLFQTQEYIEPWVLNAQRGVSTANRGVEADAIAEGIRRNLANTSVIRQGDTDAIEYGAQMMAGRGVVQALSPKRGLFSRLGLPDVMGTKRIAQLRGIMAGQGRAVRESFEQAGMGDDWLAIKSAYSEATGKVVDDNEAALRWLAEQQSSNLDMGINLAARPGERLMDYDNLIADAERWKPADIGQLRSLNLDSMARRIAYIGKHEIESIDDLRRLLANGDVTTGQVSDALREIGASSEYVARVDRALNFRWRDFWEQARESFNLDQTELKSLQSYVSAAAKTQDMKPAEFLSQIVSAGITEAKGGVKMGKELADIERALSVLRAPKEGGTAADLANQLGSVFWHHMHPSGRAAMIESLAKTQKATLDTVAKRAAVQTENTIRRSKMKAQDLMEEFLQKNPELEDDIIHNITTGRLAREAGAPKDYRYEMTSRLGPGLRTADPATQEKILRTALNIQDEFPEAQFSIDIYPIEHIEAPGGLGDPNVRGITVSQEFGDDNVIMLTDLGYTKDSGAYWKAVTERNRATGKLTGGMDEWVSSTPEGDIAHEIGHVIDNHLRLGLGEERDIQAHELALDWVENNGPSAAVAGNKETWRKVSQYAHQKVEKGVGDDEAFAELFALAFDPNLVTRGLDEDVAQLATSFREMLAETGIYKPAKRAGGAVDPRTAEWTPEMTESIMARAARGTAEANPELERSYQYFAKWAKAVLAKGALGPGDRGTQLLNDLSGIPATHATPYNATHAAMMDTVADRLRQLENDTYRMQYFARDRSLLERSINHPFFGLYPASYMWFKIMPELVRFVAKEPFGLKTGAMAYSLMDVEKAIAIQREYDPEFDAMIEKLGHSAVLWFLGYMVPATPWDIPAVAPSWMRDLSAQGLASEARAEAGLPPKDFNFWSPVDRIKDFVSPLRSADQTNRVVKEVGNILGGSPTEQAQKGGARTFPVVGPFPNEEASPVQQLAAPLTNAVDELGKILSGV